MILSYQAASTRKNKYKSEQLFLAFDSAHEAALEILLLPPEIRLDILEKPIGLPLMILHESPHIGILAHLIVFNLISNIFSQLCLFHLRALQADRIQ